MTTLSYSVTAASGEGEQIAPDLSTITIQINGQSVVFADASSEVDEVRTGVRGSVMNDSTIIATLGNTSITVTGGNFQGGPPPGTISGTITMPAASLQHPADFGDGLSQTFTAKDDGNPIPPGSDPHPGHLPPKIRPGSK